MPKLNRTASRGTFALVLSLTTVGAAAWAGCSDDDPLPAPPMSSGLDGSASDGTTGTDGTTTTDGPTNTDSSACNDPPVDCTKTAANTVVDDGGFGSFDAGPQSEVPIDLRCTKLYSCFSTKAVAADHRNYVPAFKLYSDGAEKERWLYLPPGTTIDTGGGDAGTPDDWIFPIGTMVYKEFKLNGKRIETRRTWKAAQFEWVYSVWRWADDESSATLTYAGALVPNPVHAGKMYEVPKPTACENCHAGQKDKILSIDAWSMGAPGATGLSLAQLKTEGKLSSWDHPTAFAVPEDSTGKLGAAQSFYYNNCGFCHKPGRPGGGGGLHLYLPVAPALPAADGGLPDGGAGIVGTETPVHKTAINQDHIGFLANFPSASGYKRIVPGDAGLSVVYQRDSIRDPDGGIAPQQMPPVFLRTVDQASVEATKSWIESLP